MRWLTVLAMALSFLPARCQNELTAPDRLGWLQEKLDVKMEALPTEHPTTEEDTARYLAAMRAFDRTPHVLRPPAGTVGR